MTREQRAKLGLAFLEAEAQIAKLCKTSRQLACDVLMFAAAAGMPESYWLTDRRIRRACDALGWTPEAGRRYGQGRWRRAVAKREAAYKRRNKA